MTSDEFHKVVYAKPTGETSDEVAHRLGELIKGKSFVITGASPDSLGIVALSSLVKAGAGTIFSIGRSIERAQAGFEGLSSKETKLIPIQADLSSIKSVKQALQTIENSLEGKTVDYLLGSAGIMATPFELTTDGIESQFAVNHLSHFLLATHLVESAKKQDGAPLPRLVFVTSLGYRGGPFREEDYNFQNGKEYDPWKGYGQSKSANILLARAFADRNDGVIAFSVNPGLIQTGIMRHLDQSTMLAMGFADQDGKPKAKGTSSFGLDFSTPQQGAGNLLFALLEPSIVSQNGEMIDNCKVEKVDEPLRDPNLAKKLVIVSEKIIDEVAL